MKRKMLLFFISALICRIATAQNVIKKPGSPLNHPALNYRSPYMSADGLSLLFQSDNTENKVPALFFTTKTGADWKEPVQLPKTINGALTFYDGSTLSSDGKEVWISTQRGGGLGGYDLVLFRVKPDGFSEGRNIGMPINSKEHEASIVFTPDGSMLYFMRCGIMSPERADGCRILSSKKKPNGTWDIPQDLPGHINQGNSMFPRILADGETLIFLSDRHEDSRGVDYFMTRLENDSWSTPVALDFINTEKDDRPISITPSGRSVFTALQGTKKYELAEVMFPAELKPKTVLRVNGSIAGLKDPSAMYLSVYDSASGKQLQSLRPDATGAFNIFLSYEKNYVLFADPADNPLPFFRKVYNLTSGYGQVIEKLTIDVLPLQSGATFDLGVVSFLENTAPSPSSVPVLNRVIRMLQANKQTAFQVQCDNADIYDLFFRHLRKKGINNDLELMIPEVPGNKIILISR
ncbi:MAG: hypothetical protein ACO3FI_07460 [Cyclobacteriaceae bacterium]